MGPLKLLCVIFPLLPANVQKNLLEYNVFMQIFLFLKLNPAVFPSSAVHVYASKEEKHAGVDEFRCPAYCYVEPQPFYDDCAVDRIDCECYKFELEGCVCVSRSGYSKEQDLSSYIQRI